jgi:hypothetical protein
MAVQQIAVNILSNEADREKLFKVVKECSDSMTRIEGENDFIKESIADISKQLQLPKKLVSRLVKVYHKQNFDEEVAVHEQFETLYESVVK